MIKSGDYAIPFIRYLFVCNAMKDIRIIVIGQDPYRKDIYPYYGAAFSYDINKSGSDTPSVNMIYDSIMHFYPKCEISKSSIIKTYSDCYDLSRQGVIFINASYTSKEQSPEKIHELINVVTYLRDLVLKVSSQSSDKIRVIAMGNLAQQAGSMLVSSLNQDMKCRMELKQCVNPAALARMEVHERLKVGGVEYLGKDVTKTLYELVSNGVVLKMSDKTGNYESLIRLGIAPVNEAITSCERDLNRLVESIAKSDSEYVTKEQLNESLEILKRSFVFFRSMGECFASDMVAISNNKEISKAIDAVRPLAQGAVAPPKTPPYVRKQSQTFQKLTPVVKLQELPDEPI